MTKSLGIRVSGPDREARREDIRRLVSAGLKDAEIARELGVTRNTVIGARHRMKVSGNTSKAEWKCINGHDRCDQMLPGPDCPYCEKRASPKATEALPAPIAPPPVIVAPEPPNSTREFSKGQRVKHSSEWISLATTFVAAERRKMKIGTVESVLHNGRTVRVRWDGNVTGDTFSGDFLEDASDHPELVAPIAPPPLGMMPVTTAERAILPVGTPRVPDHPILSLTEYTCRWPFNDPRGEDFRYCLASKPREQPYCAEHTALGTTDRRRVI